MKRSEARKNSRYQSGGGADLGRKIISGSSWSVFSNIAAQVVSFSVTVVLARLLTPVDFGVVAISAVFTGVITLFQDLGMGSAIIQKKEIDEDYLSTSFTVSLIAGVSLAASLAIASSYIAAFYGQEILRPILLVSSLGFIFSPFTSIHNSLLSKRHEFRKVSILNFTAQAVAGSISVAFAYAGLGVWSLVLGKIISQPLLMPAYWRTANWRPRIGFVRRCFRELFGFSSGLLGFNIINFFARNLDNLIIGKYLGPQVLGYYSVAYNLMLKPLQLISWSVGKVLFPVFSSIQDDIDRTRAVYLKIVRSISLITFPMMTGLFMVAEEFVLTVYGPRWQPAILPLKLLCIVGALQSIGTTGGVIFNAQGRTDLTLKVGVVSATAIIISFIIGIQWGLYGLITAYIFISIPVFLVNQLFSNRLIGLTTGVFLKSLIPAALSSFAMVASLALVRAINIASFHLEIKAALIMFISLGMISYVLFAAKVLKVPEVTEALQMVKRRL